MQSLAVRCEQKGTQMGASARGRKSKGAESYWGWATPGVYCASAACSVACALGFCAATSPWKASAPIAACVVRDRGGGCMSKGSGFWRVERIQPRSPLAQHVEPQQDAGINEVQTCKSLACCWVHTQTLPPAGTAVLPSMICPLPSLSSIPPPPPQRTPAVHQPASA